MRTDIEVCAGWLHDSPVIGTYAVERQSNVVMFRYDLDWLGNQHIQIDPQLLLYEGWQYCQTSNRRSTFGFVSDASPDRWGRNLIIREERREAKAEGRRIRTLLPEDYLLKVSDTGRSGGLRFRLHDGNFLSENNNIPKLTELRKLEHAALQYDDPKGYFKDDWIRDIIEPGSSLGGARPKANVLDQNGDLWIAKFPSEKDHINIAAWEKVAMELAKGCGICVPENRIIKGSREYGDIFLSKRFDRGPRGIRLHMMSAMTALELTDSDASESGKGFLDIAEYLTKEGSDADHDLKELFSRIAFSVCISNADCHFRNHAFILSENGGWKLSPTYDLNPTADKGELAIPVTDSEKDIDIKLVLETAPFYRLSTENAVHIISNIQDVVRMGWRKTADRYGISGSEQEYMSQAFLEAEKSIR